MKKIKLFFIQSYIFGLEWDKAIPESTKGLKNISNLSLIHLSFS